MRVMGNKGKGRKREDEDACQSVTHYNSCFPNAGRDV